MIMHADLWDAMSAMQVRLRSEFCAGHRILGLAGPGAKCRNIHGHNFTCWWTFKQGVEWPPVIEFGFVKVKLKDMLDGFFDHAFILWQDDDFLTYLEVNDLKRYTLREAPTTEAIAAEIARLTMNEFPDLVLVHVQLTEGSNNEAVWMADGQPESGGGAAGNTSVSCDYR